LQPYLENSKPQALSPLPQTLEPNPYTSNVEAPEPWALHYQLNSSLKPQAPFSPKLQKPPTPTRRRFARTSPDVVGPRQVVVAQAGDVGGCPKPYTL